MAKTPRLDRYARTFSRFYEPLVLLHILGKDKAPNLTSHHDPRSLVAVRHRFLKNLAFLCDHRKGGATTTAIAVEDRADCYKFWLAMNETPSVDVEGFLAGILGELKGIAALSESQRTEQEQELTTKYLLFATKRLTNECKLLSNLAKKCCDMLEARSAHEGTATAPILDAQLADWLRRFDFKSKKDLPLLCQLAYQSRHDPHARRVENLGADPEDGSSAGPEAMAFRSLGHFMGRISAHTRVVKELIADGTRLQPLLEVFCVEMLEPPECAPLPPADSHTTLEGILNRMVKETYPRKKELGEVLSWLDHQINLEAAVLEQYSNKTFVPRVHAEVQLLDHFYEKQLRFAADDRFIACSKPACFCCSLYFRHHPARFVEPDSHGNLRPNWGVARLPGGAEDGRWVEQRNILIKMNDDIREVVKERIFALGGPSLSGPDSLSGITRSNGDVSDYSISDGETLRDEDFGSEFGTSKHFPCAVNC